MLRLGIVGLPGSGKTSVFRALTEAQPPRSESVGRGQEIHVAIVKVPDTRLEWLNQLYRPRKCTPAEIEYVDFPAAGVAGTGSGEAAWTGIQRTMDSLVLVVRAFAEPSVPHEGPIDPVSDAEKLQLDLIVSDLALIERRLDRLRADLRRTRAADRGPIEREMALFSALSSQLEAGIPLREGGELGPNEERLIRGFQFLSWKPVLYLINLEESRLAGAPGQEAAFHARIDGLRSAVASMAASLEADLAELEPGERRPFMVEAGITELGTERVIRRCYDLNGLVSFFTVSEDEVRAWTVSRSTKAPQAAGAVHSDMERGFIRAEVVAYEDLYHAGSMAEARRLGLVKQEGREYIVRDGDILHFLFGR